MKQFIQIQTSLFTFQMFVYISNKTKQSTENQQNKTKKQNN